MPQYDEFGNPIGSAQKWKNRLNEAGYKDPWDAYFLNNYDPATSAENNPPTEKGTVKQVDHFFTPQDPGQGEGSGAGDGGQGGYFPGSSPPGYKDRKSVV